MDFNQCSECTQNKIITVSENKRIFVINNPKPLTVCKVLVDGCLVKDERQRCDYLFEIGMPIEKVIYVELKGSDIEKAFKQLEATINMCNERHKNKEKCCHIVASRVPKIGPKIQALKKKFANIFKIPVYLSTTKQEISV